jgi:hypothetical protein
MSMAVRDLSLVLVPQPKILMRCPICQNNAIRLFKKEGHWIQSCQRCHHQYVEMARESHHVTAAYGDDYFSGGGAGYPDYLAEADLIRDHGRRYAKLIERYMKPGRQLDVGAAAGFVLQGFVQNGWVGKGLEPNDRMASHARNQLNLDVRTGSLEQLAAGERYDLVSMIQVIPHLWDLRQALAQASEATEIGGYWLIETWNRESRMAKLFGKHWHEYSPPTVLHWFGPEDLDLLAGQFGFREVDRGRPQKWIKGNHVKSLLSYKLRAMGIGKFLLPLLGLIPDRLRIPYPSEDLFWVLYQKEA